MIEHIASIIVDEVAWALGLGTARLVWRWGWPRVQSWARDFALTRID